MRILSVLLLLTMLVVGCGKSKPSEPKADSDPSNTPSPNSAISINSDHPKTSAHPGTRVPVSKVTAIELFDEYDRNPLAADKKYKGKFVEVTGSGSVRRGAGGKYIYGFTVAVFPGMTQAQLNRLTPRERQWFQEGGYPPSVIATLNSQGEDAAANLKGGEVRVVGVVRGSKEAEGWRNFVVELDDCTLQPVERASPPGVPVVEMPKEDQSYQPWNERAYDEKVIVHYLDGDKYLTPMKNVPAHRRPFQGLIIIDIIPGPCADLLKGSEIIDKDGIVFDVILSHPNNSSFYQSISVKPKKKLTPLELTAIINQAKEDPPKIRPWKSQYRLSYDEKVTVRRWYNQKFFRPVQNVPAHRSVINGKMVFYTISQVESDKTPKGSEIIDKDGNVFTVERAIEESSFYMSYVIPKAGK